MGATSKNIPLPLGALEVEAMVADEGIRLAKDLGLKDVIIEGDAQVVMSALAQSDYIPSSIQKIIEGSKKCLQHFHVWKANHINRNGNVAAHLLARYACNVTNSVIWVEDTPSMIYDQVCADVSFSGLIPN